MIKGKIIALILVVVVVGIGSLVVRLQDKASEATSQNREDNKLTVWCWDPQFNIYAMEEAKKFYAKDHPGFTIEIVEISWNELQTKLTTAATSGNLDILPDIMLMQDNAFQKNQLSYPEAFVDLTDSKIDFSKFAEGKLSYSIVDGKNYGVPFENGTAIACYRLDVLEEAGYSIEDFTDITWQEYIEKGKDVLAKTGKPLLSTRTGESDLVMMMLQSAGASLFDADGNPNIVDNKALKEVIEVYTELVKSGVMVEVNGWDQYVETFISGTVSGTMNGCWIMASIQVAKDQAGKWGITNMPKLDDVEGATNYSNNGGSSWVITSNCKNVELAEDFLATTFAGSVEFYETILPSSGALATYLPAASSSAYSEPQAFFNNEPVYAMVTDFASKVPSNNEGMYYYEARDAIASAITNIVSGADIEKEIMQAESTINFVMGK